MGQQGFIEVDGVRIPKGPATKALEAELEAKAVAEVEKVEGKPAKKKKAAPKRARNDKGQLVADDPSTPDVNEAYEGGVGPDSEADESAE